MDKSGTYIRMCEKAREIQIYKVEEAKFEEGDYIYDDQSVHILGHNYMLLSSGRPNFRIPVLAQLGLGIIEEPISYNYNQETCIIETKTVHGVIQALYNPLWLPTQSQLQEMLLNRAVSNIGLAVMGLLGRFNEFCYRGDWHNLDVTNSLEQLWLAFVMKELYSKIWNGEDWVIYKRVGKDEKKLGW